MGSIKVSLSTFLLYICYTSSLLAYIYNDYIMMLTVILFFVVLWWSSKNNVILTSCFISNLCKVPFSKIPFDHERSYVLICWYTFTQSPSLNYVIRIEIPSLSSNMHGPRVIDLNSKSWLHLWWSTQYLQIKALI